jgi:predicted nucleic acid-binding protein
VIHVDTSILVDALTGPRTSAGALREVFSRGERLAISALVLYEWLRGPRRDRELADQEDLFPTDETVAFGHREARLAADLHRAVPRARQREFDLGIAACALTHGARLWTLNPSDFHDVPDLILFSP